MKISHVVAQVALFTLAMPFFVNNSSAQVASYSPKVGQAHPDFILPSIEDGKPIQLSSLRGKKVLLMHFASW
jgi:hypothetical protein